jgi:hypothetical protein
MYFISAHIELYAVEARLFDAKNNGVMAKAGKEHKKLFDVVAYFYKGLSVMG